MQRDLEYAKSAIANEAKSRKRPEKHFGALLATFDPNLRVKKTISVHFVALVTKQY